MNSRKKLLWAFIAVIIIVLLFSVLWVVVLYLWGNNQWYQQPSIQDIDLTVGTSDWEVITIPADNTWETTITVWDDNTEPTEENNEIVVDLEEELNPEIEAEVAPTDDLPENPEA